MRKEFTTYMRILSLTIPQTTFTTSVVTYLIPHPLKEVNSSSCLALYTQLHSSVIAGLYTQVNYLYFYHLSFLLESICSQSTAFLDMHCIAESLMAISNMLK